METKMQSKFRTENCIELIKILYPGEDLSEFKKIRFYPKYTWICISAYRKARYSGPVHPSNMIGRSRTISFGIDTYWTGTEYTGSKIKLSDIDPKKINIQIWKFVDDNSSDDKFTEDQLNKAVEYLNSVGIYPATPSEYFHNYYKD